MDVVLTVRAILHVFVEPGKLEDVEEALAMAKIPEVIDIYEVTGEYDVIATAKANALHRLKSLISERLMRMHSLLLLPLRQCGCASQEEIHIFRTNSQKIAGLVRV